MLLVCASGRGNLLLNIGPRGDGSVPEKSAEIIRTVGEWLRNGGEEAVTHWTALGCRDGLTTMEITLETGRTHQIRVHFASLGTPLAGDDMYGGNTDKISRHALHCAKLRLTHPVTGEELIFAAPVPEDMSKICKR